MVSVEKMLLANGTLLYYSQTSHQVRVSSAIGQMANTFLLWIIVCQQIKKFKYTGKQVSDLTNELRIGQNSRKWVFKFRASPESLLIDRNIWLILHHRFYSGKRKVEQELVWYFCFEKVRSFI